jgi:hypothetical protein
MPEIVVSIINASTVVSDEECRALTAALQQQVTRDFAPAWGIDAKLTFVPKVQAPAAGTWWLSILVNTDRGGVLGHHDLTPDGLPISKLFAGTDQHFGYEWTVTASHELIDGRHSAAGGGAWRKPPGEVRALHRGWLIHSRRR